MTSRGSMLLLECELYYVPMVSLGLLSKYTKNVNTNVNYNWKLIRSGGFSLQIAVWGAV